MGKMSIRFYNDCEVRAIWDDENSKWWFSIVDIVGAITESPNPRKYWSVLKSRLKKNGNELTTRCSQLKMTANDGKKYATDCYAQEDVSDIVKLIPSKRTVDFLDWFTYSDNTIDGRSKKKAYAFLQSNLVADEDVGTTKALQQIHAYIFGGLYDFAGQIRQKNISKGGFQFAVSQFLGQTLAQIDSMPQTNIEEIVDKYVEMNIAHPFMEGNGRSTRIWLDLILKRSLKRCVDWSKIDKNEYMEAMRLSPVSPTKIRELIANALTDKINDREMFMKGIDYSYYYEQEDSAIN